MNVKTDLNLRTVQEQVGDNVQQMRNYSYKAAMAYVGLFGMAYDFGKNAMESSTELLDKAEERGEEMVRELNEQLDKYQSQAVDEAKKLRTRVEDQVEGVTKTINPEAIQQNMDKVLTRVGINRSDVTATVIDVKSDLQEMVLPFQGYDELTVKELSEKLSGMGDEALKAVRAYEAGTKNRVTVLRQIDEMLEGAKEAVAA